MRCWKCGADVGEGSVYCGACGANLRDGPHAPPPPDMDGWDSGGSSGSGAGGWDSGSDSGSGAGGWNSGGGQDWQSSSGGETLLKALCLVCAVSYGGRTVLTLLYVIRSILFGYLNWFENLRVLLFGVPLVLLGAWMCLILAMLAFRRTRKNSDGLLLCLGCGAGGLILVRVLGLLVNVAVYPGSFSSQLQTLLNTVLGAAITFGGVCLIIRFVLGELPFAGRGPEDFGDAFREAFTTLGQTAGEAGAQANRRRQQQDPYGQQGYRQQDPYGQQGYRQQDPYGQQNPYRQNTPPGYGPFHLKTDRSLLVYIFLTLVTCGIYGYYTIYALARDVNAACNGDGQHTPGLLQFILLNLVTCGFYTFYWNYSLGNRLFNNGPRYGLNIQETGVTVLLWMLVGMLFCGIGPLIALFFIFRNANAICAAYNYQHGC